MKGLAALAVMLLSAHLVAATSLQALEVPEPTVVYAADGRLVDFTGLHIGPPTAWDFGDGNVSAGEAVTHLYGQDGTYNVTASGPGGTVTVNVTVLNAAPRVGILFDPATSALLPLDREEGDAFGASLDGDGAWVAVGQPGMDGGRVVLFEHRGGLYERHGPMKAPGPGSDFGGRVALDGVHLVIGAPGDGAVYVSSMNSPWSTPTFLTSGPGVGAQVEVEGEVLLVAAAPPSEVPFTELLVYRHNGTAWLSNETLTFPGYPLALRSDGGRSALVTSGSLAIINHTYPASLEAGFSLDLTAVGPRVDMQGDLVALGLPEIDAVHLYRYNGSAWVPGETITAPPPIVPGPFGPLFGHSVRLAGETLYVGAPIGPADEGGPAPAHVAHVSTNGSLLSLFSPTPPGDDLGTTLYVGHHLMVGQSDGSLGSVVLPGTTVPADVPTEVNSWLWPEGVPLQVRWNLSDPEGGVVATWTSPRATDAERAVFELGPGSHDLVLSGRDEDGVYTNTTKRVYVCDVASASVAVHEEDIARDVAGPSGTRFALSYLDVAPGSAATVLASACDGTFGFDGPAPPTLPVVTMVSIDQTGSAGDRIRINITYSAADLARAGVTDQRLSIHYWTGVAWVDTGLSAGTIAGATPERDLTVYAGGRDGNTVWIEVNHTSTYGLFQNPAPGGGGPGTPPAPPAPPSPPSAPSAPSAPASSPAVGASPSGAFPTATAVGPVSLRILDADGKPVQDLAQGILTVEVENGGPETRLWVVTDAGARELTLADGRAVYDSREIGNGPARFEAREGDDVLARGEVLIENPRAAVEVGLVAALVATGVLAFSGAAATPIGSSLAAAFSAAAEESGIAMAEEQVKSRKRRRVLARSILALVVAAILMTIFFTFEAIETLSWSNYLSALPYVGGAALAFFLVAAIVEETVLWSSRSAARFRFHVGGALTLALSAVLFRVAVGVPGYVDETKEHGPKVIRSLASLSGYLMAMLVFVFTASTVYGFYEAGITLVLATFATSALPFRPLPGNDLWHTHKVLSWAAVIGAFWLYALFLFGLVGPAFLFLVGLAGMVSWVSLCAYLRIRDSPAYARFVAWLAREERMVLRHTPHWAVAMVMTPHNVAKRFGDVVDHALHEVEEDVAIVTHRALHALHLEKDAADKAREAAAAGKPVHVVGKRRLKR